ncbi:ribonuclease H-like domain-containing protein, partial [Tanacetum coccineum]
MTHHKLTSNNWFSVKDCQTKLLLHCDITGDLYPITQQPSSTTSFALLTLSPTTWHRRLGHPGEDVLHLLETWALVPRPPNMNVLRSMWLFEHKFNADGSLSSLMVKPATICTVLSLAIFRDWAIHQLDVKNAFLHGHLSETVYMHQPLRFVDSIHPDHVCHLHRSLYGLNQAPRAWFQHFASFDNIILSASFVAILQRIIALLHSEFAMTDLDSLNYFLDSVNTKSKLGSDGGPQVCLYMHYPCDPHFTALKRILRYVRGTLEYGLQLHVSSTAQLTAYTYVDW